MNTPDVVEPEPSRLFGKVFFVAIFLSVGTAFLAMRSGAGLVWNDSPQMAENLYGFEQKFSAPMNPICRDEGAFGLRWETVGIFPQVLRRAFGCFEFGGYRPISTIFSLLGVAIFSDDYAMAVRPNVLSNFWTYGIAILFGFTAVVVGAVASLFTRSKWSAAGVVLLYFCSPPIVTGSWVLFSGIQILVPLVIGAEVLFYFRLVESRRPGVWQAGLAVVLFVGPWIREFTGVIPVLLLAHEVIRVRRFNLTCGLCLLGFFHAVFPTALPHFFIGQLPLLPVYKLGFLSAQLQAAPVIAVGFFETLVSALTSLKWQIGQVFLVLLPPSIFLLVGFGLEVGWLSRLRGWRLGLCLVLQSALVVLAYRTTWFYFLVLCSAVALAAFARKSRSRIFLGAWFFVSYLPFLKVYAEHVHLAYALLPAVILTVLELEDVFSYFVRDRGWGRAFAGAVFLCLLIGFADQLIVPYGSFLSVSQMYGGIEKLADWTRKFKTRSFVIANAPHAEDIRLYSKNRFVPYWSVRAGVPPERTLEKPTDLAAFLSAHMTDDVFFLDVSQDFAAQKWNYHAHKYVTRKAVAMEAVYHLENRAYVPFLDPLRMLLPRELTLFLGPPDLENDFYFGKPHDGRKWMTELSVDYDIYKVLGRDVSPAMAFQPDSTFYHLLFLQSLKDYSLYAFRDEFVAAPAPIPLTEKDVKENSVSGLVRAHSFDELRKEIDRLKPE